VVVKLVDITTQKRTRSEVVRPAVHISDEIWSDFKFIYNDKTVRDSVISKLLQLQIKNEIVVVEYNIS
jgi:hypothetical protein